MLILYSGFILLAFVVSWLVTGVMRRYALTKNLLDIPNARSSHSAPTPRGGGLAIVLTFLGSLVILTGIGRFEMPQMAGLLVAGALVALVGFIDDHTHISARWRLLAHFIAVGWVLFWFGGLPSITVLGITPDTIWLGYILATIYLVWLLNLYNFMDGIDGIAGIEAITVCLGGIALYWLVDPIGLTWIGPALLLVSVAGFLVWNFPHARIFMGDVGSGFLGLILGAFSIQAALVNPLLFWGWVILLGAFVVDATVTLVRRVWRGEKFYEAHHSHAYQHAASKYKSHIPVSLTFGAINLFWLLPVAALVAKGLLDGVIGVVIAYVPLISLAFRFKAGSSRTVS